MAIKISVVLLQQLICPSEQLKLFLMTQTYMLFKRSTKDEYPSFVRHAFNYR